MKGFNFNFYKSIQNHRFHRQHALKIFQIDYDKSKYYHNELPILKFEDNNFDIVLSSHLLFVYDDRFSYEFHYKTIKEMLRVAKKVQIFPLINFQNNRVDEENNFSLYVYKILDDLKEYKIKIEKVSFEFQPRGNYQMVIEHNIEEVIPL